MLLGVEKIPDIEANGVREATSPTALKGIRAEPRGGPGNTRTRSPCLTPSSQGDDGLVLLSGCLPGAWALTPPCHLNLRWVFSLDRLLVLHSGICLVLCLRSLWPLPCPALASRTKDGLAGNLLVFQGTLNIGKETRL